MNSNIETKTITNLNLQLTRTEANAIYRDLLYMNSKCFLDARTRELMGSLKHFLSATLQEKTPR